MAASVGKRCVVVVVVDAVDIAVVVVLVVVLVVVVVSRNSRIREISFVWLFFPSDHQYRPLQDFL